MHWYVLPQIICVPSTQVNIQDSATAKVGSLPGFVLRYERSVGFFICLHTNLKWYLDKEAFRLYIKILSQEKAYMEISHEGEMTNMVVYLYKERSIRFDVSTKIQAYLTG